MPQGSLTEKGKVVGKEEEEKKEWEKGRKTGRKGEKNIKYRHILHTEILYFSKGYL